MKTILHEYGQWKAFKIILVAVDESPVKHLGINPETCRQLAYANLLSRVEKAIGGDFLIIHDGIEDLAIIHIVRKLQIINIVKESNKSVKKIIEDPIFKRNSHSYFLQAADHLAYATLHYFDTRSNGDISQFLIKSEVLNSLGVAEACSATRVTLPGLVPVPTPSSRQ